MGLGAASNFTQDGYNFVAGGDRLTVPEAVCAPAGPLGATTTLHEAGPGPDPTLPDDLRFNSADNCWSREMGGDHGLHVSGTIGAIGNDALGVTGINWKVSIRPVRVLDVTGGGSSFDVAQGILYAAGLPASDGNGGTVTAPSRASVINLSIGGPDDSVLASAVTAATSAGSLLIASAGNGETSDASFPAGYPEVVGVSSIGPDLSLSSFTNIGGNVSLAAPGGNFRSGGVGFSGILSTTWNYVTQLANYAFYEGTSMAAPHVTGIAALVLEANPGMTNAQLRARLQSTALHVGAPGRNDQHGFGIVNAYNAITNSVGPTRKLFASVYNAATGAQLQTVAVAANGTYSFSRLPAGSYFVYGGEDENSDGVIGVPGRRFGWFGGAGAPTPIAITTGGNASSSFTVGTPIESKPHSTIAASNKLVVNSYMIGQITATDGPGVYSIQVPGAVKYFFEAGAVLGTCGFGIELNTKLELLDANGATLATNDDAGLPGGPFCSGINGTFQGAGQYYLRVSGSTNPNGPPQPTGQYRIWVRDQP